MMIYKYSICYPNQKEVEHRNEIISANEVMSIAKNYPWKNQLMLSDSLNENSVYYNPSLNFTSLSNKKSFGLTAEFSKNNELEFSLWYDRPKKERFLFGLLGDKEKMVLDEVSSVDFEMSLIYLGHFVKGNYLMLEKLYHK